MPAMMQSLVMPDLIRYPSVKGNGPRVKPGVTRGEVKPGVTRGEVGVTRVGVKSGVTKGGVKSGVTDRG
jgi:hypothetical protein